MTEADPTFDTNGARRAGRRATDPALQAAGQSSPGVPNLPAVTAQPEPRKGASVEAQILGQDGQKRGLRGGKPVLDQARSAYLGAEWSGRADRRPRQGVITKTEI